MQAGFRKSKRTRDQIANIHWISREQGNSRKREKKIYFCFTDYKKAFDYVITTHWEIRNEMGEGLYLTGLLRNLYTSQEATVRVRHGATDWFRTGKGVR